MSNGLMTGQEVADLFLVDPKTVVRWAELGLVKSLRTPGGHRRYYRTDIEAALKEGAAVTATKRLYVPVAHTLNKHALAARSGKEVGLVLDIARDLATEFKQDNMHFRTETFMDVVTEGVKVK